MFLLEQLRVLLEDLAAASDPRMEMDSAKQTGIENILTHHVAPYTPAQPTILDVGFGMRPEELVALRHVLNPRQIVGIESGSLGDIGFPKWRRHVRGLPQGERQEVNRHITVRRDDVWGMDREAYDIVCAFSIAPLLQNERTIKTLRDMATSLIVITTYKDSIYRFGDRVEHEHIDYLLEPWSGQLLVRKEPIQGPTTDGYIWVMQTSL